MCLIKYIEQEKDINKIKLIEKEYAKRCDVINPENNELSLSFDRFKSFSFSNKWFSNSKLD